MRRDFTRNYAPEPLALWRRKHPPVSGGKRPLCALGVPPGWSRGIGGCARAPCVFLAAAEGMARGCAGVRRGNPVLLPNWWSRPGPASASAPGPASESEAGFGGPMSLFAVTQISWLPLQTRCRTHAAAMLAFVRARRWALALRPEHHPRNRERSVGTRRAASMQDTLSEGTARAAQLAPSAVTAPAQSEDLPSEVWWPTLSDDDERLARRRATALRRVYLRIHPPCDAALQQRPLACTCTLSLIHI